MPRFWYLRGRKTEGSERKPMTVKGVGLTSARESAVR